jgi:hypothetical protein
MRPDLLERALRANGKSPVVTAFARRAGSYTGSNRGRNESPLERALRANGKSPVVTAFARRAGSYTGSNRGRN